MTAHFLQFPYIATLIFFTTAIFKQTPTFELLDFLWIVFFTLLASYFAFDVATFCGTVRFNIGSFSVSLRKDVAKPLVLFDNEWNPECLKVREALSSLGIPALIYPIPHFTTNMSYFKNYPVESRFLADAIMHNPYVSVSLPLLFDPNTKAVVFGNGEIVNNYIYSYYSKRLTDIDPPPPLTIGPLDLATSLISTTLRKMTLESTIARPAVYNKLPLHLYGNQMDAATRVVREWLCRLQLSYIIFPTSRGSIYRALLVHHIGSFYYAQRTKLVYDRFSVLTAYEHEKKKWVDFLNAVKEKEKQSFIRINGKTLGQIKTRRRLENAQYGLAAPVDVVRGKVKNTELLPNEVDDVMLLGMNNANAAAITSGATMSYDLYARQEIVRIHTQLQKAKEDKNFNLQQKLTTAFEGLLQKFIDDQAAKRAMNEEESPHTDGNHHQQKQQQQQPQQQRQQFPHHLSSTSSIDSADLADITSTTSFDTTDSDDGYITDTDSNLTVDDDQNSLLFDRQKITTRKYSQAISRHNNHHEDDDDDDTDDSDPYNSDREDHFEVVQDDEDKLVTIQRDRGRVVCRTFDKRQKRVYQDVYLDEEDDDYDDYIYDSDIDGDQKQHAGGDGDDDVNNNNANNNNTNNNNNFNDNDDTSSLSDASIITTTRDHHDDDHNNLIIPQHTPHIPNNANSNTTVNKFFSPNFDKQSTTGSLISDYYDQYLPLPQFTDATSIGPYDITQMKYKQHTTTQTNHFDQRFSSIHHKYHNNNNNNNKNTQSTTSDGQSSSGNTTPNGTSTNLSATKQNGATPGSGRRRKRLIGEVDEWYSEEEPPGPRILRPDDYYKQWDHKMNSDQRLLTQSLTTFTRTAGNCLLFDPNTDITSFGVDAIVQYILTIYEISFEPGKEFVPEKKSNNKTVGGRPQQNQVDDDIKHVNTPKT